ncbi:MAG: oxidoreductase [Acaryochloris sp. RU_4_1]|nr:oxidoreductase [Acaryochloris sp. RU_4_1]NJR53726.1 oxidoreductase [Acaryochloris sp. CRU_2_0]
MEEFESLEQAFAEYAGSDHMLDLAEFQKALDLNNDFLAERLFQVFDRDQTQRINAQEFLDTLYQLAQGTTDDKLMFAFRLHDRNDDHRIDRRELEEFILASLQANQLNIPAIQVRQLIDLLFKQADTDESREITFAEFKHLLDGSPELREAMTVSPVSWLQPPQAELPSVSQQIGWRSRVHYLQNNWAKLLFLVLYFSVIGWLFVHAYYLHRDQGLYFGIARGCGAALNFNSALILVPVMRQGMSRLRKSKLNDFLPIDEHLEFHKLVGQVIFGLAVIHTLAHLQDRFLSHQSLSGFLSYGSGYTGLLLMLILLLLWFTAQPVVREKELFDLFSVAHLAYIPWLGLLLVHGKAFWQWSGGAIAAFLLEQLVRHRQSKRRVRLLNAVTLPGNVLALKMERLGFTFEASDYVYLKCPTISKFEWHPFTISSAPEQLDQFSVHIRAVGSWTQKLYHSFKVPIQENQVDLTFPIYVQGPYHSPSSHIFTAEYVMLIAGGIGVTPYASILQSMLQRKKLQQTDFSLKKVHFYWLNRDQSSFEWFLELLHRINLEDTYGLFDLNLYLTGVTQRPNIQSVTLYTAMDLLHDQMHVDLITGLKEQTHTGRPDWSQIFQAINAQYPAEKVDVFYCGPRGLSNTLSKQCNRYGFRYRKENF